MNQFKIFNEPVPGYVVWVWTIQMRGYCSLAQERKMRIIQKAFPKYFPWENTYMKIPKEVHDAFEAECYPERIQAKKEWQELIDTPLDKRKFGKGMWATMQDASLIKPVNTVITTENIVEALNEFSRVSNQRHIEALKRRKMIKKVWDKHYRKYGLSCQEPEYLMKRF